MGEMLDSDWSRPNFLRSDWLGLIGAIMTTSVYGHTEMQIKSRSLNTYQSAYIALCKY